MFRHGVKQYRILTRAEFPWFMLIAFRASAGPVPCNLISVIRWPENIIHGILKIVTRCSIAVEVDGPCRFEQPLHFNEPFRHIGNIR